MVSSWEVPNSSISNVKAYFDNAGINKGSATSWGAATANNAYSSAYTYDRNGNLKTLNRYGYSTSAMIDQLTYNYALNRNRLHRVNDGAGVAANGDISNNQLDSNYVYDRLGQLTQDVVEGITNMNWRKGDRKLRSMTRSGHIISFLYDPFGRRIAKIYRPNGTTDKTQWTYTYYGNDANGSTMAVYDIKYSSNYVYLREQHIYGAGRVGMVQLNKTIYANAVITPPATTLSTNTLGNKRYELVNHLGNVNAVITDRKAPNTGYSALAYDFDFASTGNTGWTISGCSGTTATLSSGRLRFTPGSACAFNVYKDFPVTASSPYTISFDVDRTGISSLNVEIYTTGGTTSLVGTIANPANGTITYTLTPAAGQTGIRVHFKKLSTENVSFYTDNLRIQTMASPYVAMVVSTSDYYPFGMQMPGRHKDENLYRYGYNGMEKDDEAKNLSGTSYTTEFRQYDPRLGRWASLDPLMNEFPGMSPYVAFNDNPVYYVDPLGLKGDPIGIALTKGAQAIKEFGARLRAAQTGEEYDVGEVVIKPAEGQIGGQTQSKTKDGKFTKGKYKGSFPRFSYDNGFLGTSEVYKNGKKVLYTPPSTYIKPTEQDAKSEGWWMVKGTLAQYTWLANGANAYMHFLGATGADYWVDFPDYFDDDPSSREVLRSSIDIAKDAAEELLPKSGYLEMFSDAFSIGSAGFPRSQSEDWQKTLGDFNIWMSATVSAKEINGKVEYSMTLVLHAEDRYNFNPGASDIATKTPDNVNGKFELTGQGKQFNVYGKHYVHLTWTKP